MTDAQGIVLSMAGGSLEFLEEGTWTKRLHPGWAAVCALTATAIASQGFAGPKLAYEAQFSVHYAIAASLLRHRFTLSELTAECLTNPAILDLCDRTHYEIDPHAPFPQQYAGDIVVTTRDGTRLRQTELGPDALAGALLPEDRVIAKFEENARLAVHAEAARRILDLVMRLDELSDVALLTQALCPEG